MRKVALLLVAVALVCVAASQASAGGYRHAGYAAGAHYGGHNTVVYQVARGHHGYQYAPRYYGYGRGCTSPPVVVQRPVYGHPRVVVPYAQPYYVPQRGISYHGSRLSIGIGF